VLLVVCFAAVVATVPLAGGRLGALASVRIARVWTLTVALAIQALIMWLMPDGAPALHGLAHVVSYGFIVAFLVANRRIPGLWLVALGTALNVAAITANGGVMPAAPGAVEAAGRAHEAGAFANSAVVVEPKLSWLGDVFAVPGPLPLANVFSVGDVAIVVGAALALHALCGSRLTRRNWGSSLSNLQPTGPGSNPLPSDFPTPTGE
jgi:hypothetical protein